jgi:hypothetical protein
MGIGVFLSLGLKIMKAHFRPALPDFRESVRLLQDTSASLPVSTVTLALI